MTAVDTRAAAGTRTAMIYETSIRHVRREPIENEFTYRSYSWFVDIDALPSLPGPLAPFAKIDAADHVGDPSATLRANLDDFLRAHGRVPVAGRITMLTNARVLGYVFNPLTVYWLHDGADNVEHVVAEVHNTYGERHRYLLDTDARGAARTSKEFYVSPFNDVSGEYAMRLPEPDGSLALSITLLRDGHPPFVAVMSGTGRSATTGRVLGVLARAPLAPHVVTARIRRQGIGLWARGLRTVPRPPVRGDVPAVVDRHGPLSTPLGPAVPPRSEGTRMTQYAVASTVDAERWPSIATAPVTVKARLAAPVADALFRRAAEHLAIRVEMPNGVVIGGGANDPTAPVMTIHRPRDFAARVGESGLIGFGEAYMAGDWDAPDLTAALGVFAERMATLIPKWLQRLRGLYIPKQPVSETNTTSNTRSNISRHYDLSNEMFELFLDETMTYSSALFPSLTPQPGWDDIAAAQRSKIDRLLDRAGVTAGTRVLEIGTGWGELAIRAAERGATVRSVTLSTEQLELACKRIDAAGHADRVQVDLLDYRLVDGEYDAIVSVEMIEAVGHQYWGEYFRTIDSLLAPGGKVAIQAITMPHERMLATRNTYTWVHKYIFPGGFLPSIRAIESITEKETTLRVRERLSIGDHYARTLRLWDERFHAHAEEARMLGFDDVFARMWHFYLCYSEAGFGSGYIDVQQILLERRSDR